MIIAGFLPTLCLGVLLLLPIESLAGGNPLSRVPKTDFSFVDEDTSTGRIFVSMDSGIMAKEDSLKARLLKIADDRLLNMWNGKPIKVALFSDKAFAHPKQRMPKGQRKQWAEHYLADYDSEKREIWLYPALPAKRRKVHLDSGKMPD